MRKLVLGALFVGATSLASGCIFVSDDDDPIVDDFGSLSIAWDLDPAGCPPGATTAQLVAVDTSNGDMFTDLVDCELGADFIDDLLPGLYDVSVNIVSEDLQTTFAISAVDEDVAVNAGATTDVPTFSILTEDAFFGFTWDLTEGGAPLSCDEVPILDDGATLPCDIDDDCALLSETAFCGGVGDVCRDISSGVDISATIIGETDLNATIFNCVDGAGTTQPFPLGAYTISLSVLTKDDLGDDAPTLVLQDFEDSLDIGNEVVDLGNFEFAF